MKKNTLVFPDLEDELQALHADGRMRLLNTFKPKGPVRAEFEDRIVTLFASNDYLGLSHHPEVVRALKETADTHGVGAGASRLITGTSDVHAELERCVAKFKNAEAAVVFSSGYLANWGTITAMAGKDDFIAIDKLDHASILDAARASGARVRVFPHKNYKRLEELLKLGTGYRRRLIVTDSVFSMDGDTADLKKLVTLKYKYGARLMVDEAHGTGVFGAHGRGLGEAQGVEDDIDIRMGTFSKACGTMGGFVAGPGVLIDYLRNRARSFVYSTALPPAVMAATVVALEIIENEPERRKKLWDHAHGVRDGIRGPRSRTRMNIPAGPSPIIPIIVGSDDHAMAMSRALLEAGFYVPGIRPPTVPRGAARLRVTVSAAHTERDIKRLVNAINSL